MVRMRWARPVSHGSSERHRISPRCLGGQAPQGSAQGGRRGPREGPSRAVLRPEAGLERAGGLLRGKRPRPALTRLSRPADLWLGPGWMPGGGPSSPGRAHPWPGAGLLLPVEEPLPSRPAWPPPPSPPGSPPLTATGTLSVEVLEVNDHAPLLAPLAGELCSRGGRLLLGATDEDLAPHAEPFHFQFGPSTARLPHNWTLSQSNGTLPEGGGGGVGQRGQLPPHRRVSRGQSCPEGAPVAPARQELQAASHRANQPHRPKRLLGALLHACLAAPSLAQDGWGGGTLTGNASQAARLGKESCEGGLRAGLAPPACQAQGGGPRRPVSGSPGRSPSGHLVGHQEAGLGGGALA